MKFWKLKTASCMCVCYWQKIHSIFFFFFLNSYLRNKINLISYMSKKSQWFSSCCCRELISLPIKKKKSKPDFCPVAWGCRIYQLYFCREVRPLFPTTVLDMTVNNLMVRFQWCWSFGECEAILHCHHSQVHYGPKWQHLKSPYLCVKLN